MLPALLFNLWAFGNPFTFSYANVVGDQDANKRGLFGIAGPDFRTLVELLFSPIGLLVLTPVVLAGAVGLVLVYRRGHRLDAVVAAAVAVLYLVLNAGYETPFGGNSPGPRFLVATLPFLALGLAAAYRSFPLTTFALAVGSGVEMVVLTLTNPLGVDDHGLVPSLRDRPVRRDRRRPAQDRPRHRPVLRRAGGGRRARRGRDRAGRRWRRTTPPGRCWRSSAGS